ncbi:MAG: DUF7564 family protein [Halobacteriota archaeon]
MCIDCGTGFLFTNTYKGNYCPDCQQAWLSKDGSSARRHRHLPSRPPRRSLRRRSDTHRRHTRRRDSDE